MNKNKCGIDDLLALFETTVSPADVLASKLKAQVSSFLTKERIKKNMTQAQLADYISVRQSQISRWESEGYNFSLEKIADIAAKLDVDVNISFVDPLTSRQMHQMGFTPFSRTFKPDGDPDKIHVFSITGQNQIIKTKMEDPKYVAVR